MAFKQANRQSGKVFFSEGRVYPFFRRKGVIEGAISEALAV